MESSAFDNGFLLPGLQPAQNFNLIEHPILQVDPIKFAFQLTLHQHSLLKENTSVQILLENPGIFAKTPSAEFSDSLIQWFEYQIISLDNTDERQIAFKQTLDIMIECQRLRNYQGAF